MLGTPFVMLKVVIDSNFIIFKAEIQCTQINFLQFSWLVLNISFQRPLLKVSN